MKKLILILLLSHLLIAQNEITISNVKESSSQTIVGDFLYVSYKKDKAKESSCAKINLKNFSIEDESYEENGIFSVYELAEKMFFRIVLENNTYKFSALSSSLEEEASIDIELPKNFEISSISSAFDRENNKMIIIWKLGERYYGFSPKIIIKTVTYDFDAKEFSITELDNPSTFISEILTNEVIDNKIIVRFWANKDFHFGIYDLETNKINSIKFGDDYKYFKYNAFVINNKPYFVLRSGRATSKSVYLTHDYVFKVDLTEGNAEYIATVGNTKNSLSYYNLQNYNSNRYQSNIICYGVNKFVNISYYDGKVRVLDFDNDETTYKEEESTNVPYYRDPYFYLDNNKVFCLVDGSKNVKSEVSVHTYNLDDKTLSKKVSSDVPSIRGNKFYYQLFESFHYYNGEDILINSNINKKSKTLTISK